MIIPRICLYAMTVILLAAQSSANAAEGHSDRARMTGKLTSAEIRAAIVADLDDAERLTGRLPAVDVRDGVVRLSGIVASMQEKNLASMIAKRTRGVQSVQNQILVKQSERDDAAIKADVAKVLRLNDSVAEPRIKAAVTNGEVALLGKVASLAEKRIAEFSASGVRGVTKVDNQITVAMSTDRSDEELRAEINALIIQSVYFDDAAIDVTVNDHVVSLSGAVTTAAAKDRLEAIAEIWGVTEVDVSEVVVDPDAGDPTERKRRYAEVSDQSIEEAIIRSFRYDPLLFARADQLSVSVKDGVVKLDGKVDRVFIKDRAESLIQDVVGVRRVKNDAEVATTAQQPDDMQIIRETQGAIARSAYLDRNDIRVHCQRAHLSLYGIVGSQLEKEVAHHIAGGVRGVVHVNNQLSVDRKPSGKSDQRIKSDLERKLAFALFDQSNDVKVTVENGVAILRGEVDTWRQWQAVMELAIEAGSHHPHNLMNVRYHPPHGSQRYYIPR